MRTIRQSGSGRGQPRDVGGPTAPGANVAKPLKSGGFSHSWGDWIPYDYGRTHEVPCPRKGQGVVMLYSDGTVEGWTATGEQSTEESQARSDKERAQAMARGERYVTYWCVLPDMTEMG